VRELDLELELELEDELELAALFVVVGRETELIAALLELAAEGPSQERVFDDQDDDPPAGRAPSTAPPPAERTSRAAADGAKRFGRKRPCGGLISKYGRMSEGRRSSSTTTTSFFFFAASFVASVPESERDGFVSARRDAGSENTFGAGSVGPVAAKAASANLAVPTSLRPGPRREMTDLRFPVAFASESRWGRWTSRVTVATRSYSGEPAPMQSSPIAGKYRLARNVKTHGSPESPPSSTQAGGSGAHPTNPFPARQTTRPSVAWVPGTQQKRCSAS
jgi:hypothetical protein